MIKSMAEWYDVKVLFGYKKISTIKYGKNDTFIYPFCKPQGIRLIMVYMVGM